jgi:hypothetical protein
VSQQKKIEIGLRIESLSAFVCCVYNVSQSSRVLFLPCVSTRTLLHEFKGHDLLDPMPPRDVAEYILITDLAL